MTPQIREGGWEAELHQLRVGDEVRAVQQLNGVTMEATGTITGIDIGRALVDIGQLLCPARKDRIHPYKFFVLDRAKVRAPAWDAEPFSRWHFPGYPDVEVIRADTPEARFFNTMTGTVIDGAGIDKLVLSQPSRRRMLELAVLEKARVWNKAYTTKPDSDSYVEREALNIAVEAWEEA